MSYAASCEMSYAASCEMVEEQKQTQPTRHGQGVPGESCVAYRQENLVLNPKSHL